LSLFNNSEIKFEGKKFHIRTEQTYGHKGSARGKTSQNIQVVMSADGGTSVIL